MTLTVAVHYGIELAGRRGAAASREFLADAERRARQRLGRDHPARLSALYGLSLAAMRAQDYEAALDHATRAYDGQVRVLGERHRETLRTLVQLSAASYYCGDPQRARDLLQGMPTELLRQHGVLDPQSLRAVGSAS